MYLRTLILTLLMLISVGSLALGVDENCEVLQGDYNEDRYIDLYVRQIA